ncbi:MAG: methylated-DNA--[protein]-cysteine S-methyltransferase [Spirulina sp. SIO3F2]|nr:methylated-DNA--[protein]-cysteine S-methyltransferase [Spirulina sp. SIO3F2]
MTAHPNTSTYQRMAAAIAFMRKYYQQQPDLAAIAAHVQLSKHHFQRLFTQWAGISPKRFCQYLTMEYAKSQIAIAPSLLELTMTTGLSSPGRLHDLFVKLEAMSPGEYKNGGAGLKVDYGVHITQFGVCLIAQTERGICNLQFLDGVIQPEAIHTHLQTVWPNAQLSNKPTVTQSISDRLFTPKDNPPLTLYVKGTNFQIQVWRALLRIPLGNITTYQDLANRLGRPAATRAVGNAIGRNPIAYMIPCHRVLRSSGELGGYRWGVERKAALIGWEAGQVEQSNSHQ